MKPEDKRSYRQVDSGQLFERPLAHTMGENLPDYVLPKCPPAALLAECRHAVIRTSDRLEAMGDDGKDRTKLFNWQRPSFVPDGDVLHCVVSPGMDYVHHYARLLATACGLLGLRPTMEIECIDAQATYAFIDKWLPRDLPKSDAVVLGYVERVFVDECQAWKFNEGFGWKQTIVNGARVLLLGCKFSFWGDLSGALVTVLANRQIAPWVVYVGKLGTLNPNDIPNRHIATGELSLVEGEVVAWPSMLVLDGADPQILLSGQRHVTVPSVVDETTAWYGQYHGLYDLVDPEIGRMAAAACGAGVGFDFLHIITDNLSGHHKEGLYFERSADILVGRQRCLAEIDAILRESMKRHAG